MSVFKSLDLRTYCILALTLTALPLAAAEPVDQVLLDSGLYTTANGEVFHYTKSTTDGEDRLLYSRGGETLSPEELERFEATNPPAKLGEELLAEALAAAPGTELALIVWLAERPGARIAREVQAAHLPAIRALAEEIREVQRSLLPAGAQSPAAEGVLRQMLAGAKLSLLPEQQELVDRRAAEIEERSAAMRREIRRRAEAAVAPAQARFRRELEALGGKIEALLPVQNAALVRLGAQQLGPLAESSLVARIVENTRPVPMLDNQIVSLGLENGFWADGVDGGIWDVGVLDSCLEEGHPNHAHVQFLTSGNCDGTDFWGGGHGTQITGIIASDDATFRGLAFDIDRILIGSMNNMLTDADWMVNGTIDDAEVINASFGWGATSTDYTNREQFLDGLIDDERVMVSVAAGNGGSGTMTLTDPARGFNTLSVANVDDQDTVARGDDVITGSSARGPTPSGRKKPDIAAPGTGTVSTRPDGTLGNFGGTSAAAPHVVGGLILLNELRGSDEPKALKAALLNAADAWDDGGTLGDSSDDGFLGGSAWNATYGWGYLDLWEAWFNGLDVFVDSVDDGFTPAGLDFKLYKGRMFTNEKATLVWNRHVGYSGSNFPSAVEKLTDLDLIAYRQSDGSQIASSFSGINNVEQIDVSTTQDVVLKVDVFGSIDPDVGVESYALATEEGFQRADPPSFSFTASDPFFTAGHNTEVFTVTVRNTGDVTAFANRLTLSLPSSFSLVSGANPRTLPDLAPGASTSVSWTIRWNTCTSNGASASLFFTNRSTSYGESLASTGGKTVVCENLHL